MSSDSTDRTRPAASGPVPGGGSAELVSGIQHDARAEAEKIVAAAERAATERRTAAEAQAAVLRQEAGRKAEEAAKGIARQGEQAGVVERRKMGLKAREEISARILDAAATSLAQRVGQADYGEILKGWIVEAAIGLNTAVGEVLASAPEMELIDDALLRQAAAEVRAATGATVELRRSGSRPLAGQGIVLTSGDGRTAFNNQVSTRLERYRSEIRRLIYEALKES